MTSTATAQPRASAVEPHCALLAFAAPQQLTAPELSAAISRLHPAAKVAGWGGGGQPGDGPKGILLSVDGVDIAVVNVNVAAPLSAFNDGNQPNLCWMNAREELKQHKAHMFVLEAAAGELARSVARATAVTMVVDAISSLKPLMGVKWENTRNLVRADHLGSLMRDFRATGKTPVALWIRLLAGALPPPAEGGVAATYGLRFFGSPEIEIHARKLDRASALTVAISYAEGRMLTGRPTWNEAITSIENVATFTIERLPNGLFGVGPVARLTEAKPTQVSVGGEAS